MSALAPGLYRATVKGVPDQIVMLATRGDYGRVITSGALMTTYGSASEDLTDARPLIVLDLVESQVEYLRHALNRWIEWSSLTDEKRTLDGLLAQIEAQTKPARIPEPGLWGVVEASLNGTTGAERFEFVHVAVDVLGWMVTEDGSCMSWADLIDPTLIRDGVTS